MFEKIADFIMKHSKAIVVAWIIILIVAVPFALKSGEVMRYDLNDMASDQSESIQGLVTIGTYFPSMDADASSMPILVVKFDNNDGYLQSLDFATYLNDAITTDETWKEKVSSVIAVPTEYSGSGTSITLMGIVYISSNTQSVMDDTPVLRSFINETYSKYLDEKGEQRMLSMYLTGSPALSYDMSTGAMSDLERIDPFTIFLILVLVGLFFRSFITSATPPITIGFAFVVVLALIFGIGQILNIFFVTEMMLLVSMMGAGCDYCIFIISRYREELRSGKSHDEALRESIIWAGESIATSACSVIIGFGAMSICSYSLVSTMGICLAVGIIVALFAALTLIPSILNIVGDRIFWPSRMDTFKEGGKSTKGWYGWFGNLGTRYFEASAKASKRFAVPIIIAAILITVPAAYVTLNNETSYDMIGAMQTGDSGTGMDLMGEYANEGVLMPDYAVIEYDVPLAYVYTLTLKIPFTDPIVMKVLFWNNSDEKLFQGLDKLTDDIENIDDNVASVISYFDWETTYEEAKIKHPGVDTETLVALICQDLQSEGKTTYAIALNSTFTQVSQLISDYDTIAMMYPLINCTMNCNTATLGGDFVSETVTPSSSIPKEVKEKAEEARKAVEEMMPFVQVTLSEDACAAQYIKITMATQDSAMSPKSMNTIAGLKNVINEYVSDPANHVEVKWVTGTAVVMYDVSEKISGEFKMIELLVIVLIIIMLFFVMKSYTIPFRSVITILMSISWTIAMTHIVFVNILGGEVSWLVPLILLVICLGLGMDYDILLTTRIKENVIKGESNDEAIHHAVMHTGSVITICGLIMGGAFGTLMLSGMEMIQEFGFALCFAILVDALIVRTYIVPAVMHVLGDWNWKCPKFMKPKI